MRVPKTAVYKNNFSPRRKDNVGSSGQVSTMQSKPVSKGIEKPADCNLRRGIFSADAGHQRASALD
jgi:hypothetical protein